jgi:hypothetical protein
MLLCFTSLFLVGVEWQLTKFNKKTFSFDGGNFKLPDKGTLQFTFVESDTPVADVESKPSSLCAFTLDLGSDDDREVAKELIDRVVAAEDSETWESAALDGSPFQFDVSTHTHAWVDAHSGKTNSCHRQSELMLTRLHPQAPR